MNYAYRKHVPLFIKRMKNCWLKRLLTPFIYKKDNVTKLTNCQIVGQDDADYNDEATNEININLNFDMSNIEEV